MKFVRFVLGKIILFLDRTFVPALEVKRTSAEQAAVDAETSTWILYQLITCPFCVRVRREIKRLGLTIATRDIATDAQAYAELMAGGKIDQYPCLRMPGGSTGGSTGVWMYESADIVTFLQKKFKTESSCSAKKEIKA